MNAAPDRLRTDIDLRDAGLRRIEGAIGKIRAQHQKRVAGFHGVIAGGEADQAGHADVVRIVPLDVVLAAHGVNDRRLHGFGKLHQFIVRARAAAAAKKRDALRQIDEFRELAERLLGRRDHGLGRRSPASFGAGAGTAAFSATSPGTTTTLTQRSRIERRTAISSTRGICSGLDTSSQ